MDVMIRDETATGKVLSELMLAGLPDRFSVRDLIRTRVREEVARHNAQTDTLFTGLVRPTDAEAELNGCRTKPGRKIGWEQQADIAEEAFGRNGFFLLVDDHQPTDLDEELELTVDSTVAFVRLTPLVGG